MGNVSNYDRWNAIMWIAVAVAVAAVFVTITIMHGLVDIEEARCCAACDADVQQGGKP